MEDIKQFKTKDRAVDDYACVNRYLGNINNREKFIVFEIIYTKDGICIKEII